MITLFSLLLTDSRILMLSLCSLSVVVNFKILLSADPSWCANLFLSSLVICSSLSSVFMSSDCNLKLLKNDSKFYWNFCKLFSSVPLFACLSLRWEFSLWPWGILVLALRFDEMLLYWTQLSNSLDLRHLMFFHFHLEKNDCSYFGLFFC